MLRLSWQLGMTVMISKSWPLASIFLLILTNLLASAMAYSRCFNNGNYTNNSLYKSNLDSLLSSLSTNIDSNGFYNASTGQNPDTVYASVLCRGDLELNECRTCIQSATADIITSCPNYKQAFQYSDDDLCTLRYSDESMFGIPAGSMVVALLNVQNATSPDQFMLDVRELVDNLYEQAANGGSLRKVAAANRTSVGFQNVFSMVQCTPDLSVDDCRTCLIGSVSDIPRYCYGKRGCRIVKPSCLLRYEDLPFYNETRLQELQTLTTPSPPPPPPTPTPTPTPGKKDNSRTRTTIILVVSIGVCLIAAAILGILLIKRRKKKSDQTREFEAVHDINLSESLQYDFGEVKVATDDFSDGNKLGQGGFGAVYKGTLSNGQEIAVKRLSMDSGQGDVEFKNEVLLVAKLQHRNLVRLLGFSMERKERLLIYEFVENTSLDRFLFDPIKRNELDWGRRYKIMGGIARGLLYLHEESRIKIIHRDLKASNVLLDGEMNPKIADFGMARLCAADETQANTNRIVGTYGYMSPEYAMHGQFSIKSDVFSFGVLILEIVTGQKNNSFRNGETIEDLLSVAWRRWHQGTIEEMIDPVLRASPGSIRDILRCIHIGLLCVQDDPTDRPTMASTVLMLSSSTISLSVPTEPKFFTTSRFFSKNALLQEYDSKDFGSTQSTSNEKPLISTESSRNVMSITEFYPR